MLTQNHHIQGWYRLNPVTGGILLCILMVLCFWYYFQQAAMPQRDFLTIDSLSFIGTVMETGVNENIELPNQPLTHDWLDNLPNVNAGWYQAEFSIEAPPESLWAVYLPVIKLNARIYLNNRLIGQTGSFKIPERRTDAFAHSADNPGYFVFPGELLIVGKNRIKLEVQSMHGSGLLGKIYLAEGRLLRPFYDQRYTLLVTSRQTITAGMLAIAILMSVLWVLRRQDRVYFWYALMLYAWSIHNIVALGDYDPDTAGIQNILSLLALGWFVVFMVKATHTYLGQQFPGRERMMFSIGVFGSLLVIFIDSLPWSPLTTHRIWSTFAIALSGYVLLDFTVKYREREDLHNPLILPAGFSMLIFGTHDWLVLMEMLPRDNGRLLHFAAPVAVSVFAFVLLEQFARTLKVSESLNLELEHRVNEKHRELESNYQRLKQMEHKQLLAEERERFMKEIHDGVGGHLVSMLSMVRSGKQDTQLLVRAIEATLDDLRLMIDSLSPEESDIATLLGAMRVRIEPQLEAGDLKLHWQVDELPVIADFGPHKALQVMRIVQEAITNVIRHSGAENLFVKAYVEPGQPAENIVIEIGDDGCGVSDRAEMGRGIDNMQHRASEIGAEFELKNPSQGTIITLSLAIK